MRRVSSFRGACVWLAAAMLLAAASADARPLNVNEAIKRVIPQVSQQLSKLAANGKKVLITATCIGGAACMINFAAPAEAGSADFLSADAQLVKTRGVSGIFTRGSSVVEKSAAEGPGISFDHWVAKGVYHESGDNIGTLRFGTSASGKNFSVYLTTAFRADYSTIDGIDGIGVKTRSFVGGNWLMVNNGEGNMSYGYVNADTFVGGTTMHFRNARGYLLKLSEGNFQVAVFGYEYVDNDLNALSDPDRSGDPVRSHGVALYRAGWQQPLTHLFTSSDKLAINLKLNSAMHLGDIGPVKLGETWQGELNDWAGEAAELDHMIYHTGGGSINVSLADGRINISLGAVIQNTIDGDINRPMMPDGNFSIRNTIVAAGGTADLLPDHGISLEAWFERYDQATEADLDGESYKHDAAGTWARIAVKKDF